MATILATPCTAENFTYLADRILNYTLLMICGRVHRICEIEFYLQSREHPDPYVHGHIDQTKRGTWYFHRYNTGTYKNGTFKGMDLVLGDTGYHAGVLIRSIMDVEGRKFIEGPCRCVDHILSLSGIDNILTFTGGMSLNVLQNERGLVIVEGQPTILEPILCGPRIGLGNKDPNYRDKKYRYVIGPVKKQCKTLALII
jgi:3-methyladenine DNA glycosylase Mpg